MPPLASFNPRSDTATFFLPDDRAGALETFAPGRGRAATPRPAAAISATILTKNSERLLADVLVALHWCDEVVILDTGSTDRTLAIAASFSNVCLHQLTGSFRGFGVAHQRLTSLARNDWILSIDSDEIVSAELTEEIAALPLDPRTVYVVPFENYLNGKHITTCGWSPDRHGRLFNRTVTDFCASEVHERVRTDGVSVVRLRQSIRHYSYRSLEDFLRKMSAYAQLFARQHAGKKRSSPAKAVARSGWAFFKSFVLERGFLQGNEGLVISAYKSQTVFWKYLMLHEANRRPGG